MIILVGVCGGGGLEGCDDQFRFPIFRQNPPPPSDLKMIASLGSLEGIDVERSRPLPSNPLFGRPHFVIRNSSSSAGRGGEGHTWCMFDRGGSDLMLHARGQGRSDARRRPPPPPPARHRHAPATRRRRNVGHPPDGLGWGPGAALRHWHRSRVEGVVGGVYAIPPPPARVPPAARPCKGA